MGRLKGKKVMFLVANEGVEQVELTEPWKRVVAEGGNPVLVAPSAGEVQAYHHLEKGEAFPVDQVLSQTQEAEYDALVLPGGVMNPDELRLEHDALRLVREFTANGKPIASICHGPWTLVEADVVEGRTLTSWPSLATDVTNAGGKWQDQAVVVDRTEPSTLVTSRGVGDLEAFCAAITEAFEGETERTKG